MAYAGDWPTPPRTAIWSDTEAKWMRVRQVMYLDWTPPDVVLALLATEAALPIDTLLRFRLEVQTDEPAFRGFEFTAPISMATSRMMGGGCGTSKFEVTLYHLHVPKDCIAWDSKSGPSQIPTL